MKTSKSAREALENSRTKIQEAAETLFRAKEEARRVPWGHFAAMDVHAATDNIATACHCVANARSCIQKAKMAETTDRENWYDDLVQENCKNADCFAEKALSDARSALAKATDPRRPFIARAEAARWQAAGAN